MNNDTYTYCQLQVGNQNISQYCKVVNQIGELPQRNEYIYDIGFYMYWIAFLMVVLSPIIIILKITKGLMGENKK